MSDLPWDLEYFTAPIPAPEPPPILGSKYLVSAASLDVDPGDTVVITAQLADEDDEPVSQAGHIVTWEKTGVGGSFAAATSTTNALGVATIVLTVSSTHGQRHVITATDQYDFTGNTGSGVTEAIEAANDGLREIRDYFDGEVELLLDAMVGVTEAPAGFLGASTDLSGKGRTMSNGTNAPRFGSTLWTGGGGKPAFRGVRTEGRWFKALIDLPIPQPYSTIIVIDGYTSGDGTAGNQNLLNGGSGGIVYRASTVADRWAQFAGSVASSNIIAATALGKWIRFDIFNGASSRVWRSGTDGGAMAPGAGSIAAAGNLQMGILARNDGVDPTTVITPFILIVSRALDATDRAFLQSFLTTRYPGINA